MLIGADERISYVNRRLVSLYQLDGATEIVGRPLAAFLDLLADRNPVEAGNGQFGPPVNGTRGFPVGTDPTGLAVADLNGQPDLLVADTGSNDVSVLLGQGSGSSWTLIPGPRVQTAAGPVAVAVGHLLGGSQTDLAVANPYWNPRPIERDGIRVLLDDAFHGRRPNATA